MGDVVSVSTVTQLAWEAGAGAAASLRISVLTLTEPGAAFAEAGLTLKGVALVGVLVQTEGWGIDVSSAELRHVSSGWSGDE